MTIDFVTHDQNLNALNICQLDIYQNPNFMHRLKNDNVPNIFTELIRKPKHKYATKFSKNSCTSKSFSLSKQYEVLYFGSRTKFME